MDSIVLELNDLNKTDTVNCSGQLCQEAGADTDMDSHSGEAESREVSAPVAGPIEDLNGGIEAIRRQYSMNDTSLYWVLCGFASHVYQCNLKKINILQKSMVQVAPAEEKDTADPIVEILDPRQDSQLLLELPRSEADEICRKAFETPVHIIPDEDTDRPSGNSSIKKCTYHFTCNVECISFLQSSSVSSTVIWDRS